MVHIMPYEGTYIVYTWTRDGFHYYCNITGAYHNADDFLLELLLILLPTEIVIHHGERIKNKELLSLIRYLFNGIVIE